MRQRRLQGGNTGWTGSVRIDSFQKYTERSRRHVDVRTKCQRCRWWPLQRIELLCMAKKKILISANEHNTTLRCRAP